MGIILFIYERDPYGKNKKLQTLLERISSGYIVKEIESGEEGYKKLQQVLNGEGKWIKKVVMSLSIKTPLSVRKWTTIISASVAGFATTNLPGVEFSIH